MTNYHNNRLTKMIFIVIFSAAVILIGMLGCASNLPISQKPGAMLWGKIAVAAIMLDRRPVTPTNSGKPL